MFVGKDSESGGKTPTIPRSISLMPRGLQDLYSPHRLRRVGTVQQGLADVSSEEVETEDFREKFDWLGPQRSQISDPQETRKYRSLN